MRHRPGPNPTPLLETADVILVIDALAPWSPAQGEPPPNCQVIQLGVDPLQSRFGVRNFRSDLSLPGEVGPALLALKAALDQHLPIHKDRNAKRAEVIAERNRANQAERVAAAEAVGRFHRPDPSPGESAGLHRGVLAAR